VKFLALGKRERVSRCRVWGRPMSPNRWGIDLIEMVLSCQSLKANHQLCSPYWNFFFLKLSPYISLTSSVLITLKLHPLDAEQTGPAHCTAIYLFS
jgi:hypothetical protein